MGYFERLPAGYAAEPARRYPMVVFLHGAWESGRHLGMIDGSTTPGVRQRDLTRLVDPARGGDTPFVALFPQRCSLLLPPQEMRHFIDHAIATYRIDTRRIYLIGHSAGAAQIWDALPELAGRVAAAVTISGFDTGRDMCAGREVAVWSLHAADDRSVPVAHSIAFTRRLQACAPAQAPRLSVFATGGHDIDEAVLDGRARSGPATPDPLDTDVFAWLLQHVR